MARIDDEVVAQLRALADRGMTGVELVRALDASLVLAEPSRVVVFASFCAAFDLALADVMGALGPWRGFEPDGPLDDDGFDRAFRRLRDEAGNR